MSDLFWALVLFLAPLPAAFIYAAPLAHRREGGRALAVITVGALLSFLGLLMVLFAVSSSTLGALS